MLGGYLNFRDLFDGGGAGASGSEFKGAPISGLLNTLGVRPAGYAERTARMPTMAPKRPSGLLGQRQPQAAAPMSYGPQNERPISRRNEMMAEGLLGPVPGAMPTYAAPIGPDMPEHWGEFVGWLGERGLDLTGQEMHPRLMDTYNSWLALRGRI